MKKETADILWAISLLICGTVGIIAGLTGILGVDIPDVFTRVLGVISLIGLALLGYTSVIQLKNRKKK